MLITQGAVKNSPSFFYNACRYDHLLAGQEFATLTSLRKDSDGCFGGDRSIAAFAPPFFLRRSVAHHSPALQIDHSAAAFSVNRAVFSAPACAFRVLFRSQSISGQCLSAHGTVVKRPIFARIAAVRRRTKLTTESESVNEEDLP